MRLISTESIVPPFKLIPQVSKPNKTVEATPLRSVPHLHRSAEMKMMLLILLTAILPLDAEESFKSVFDGKVEIEEATYFLNGDTGGSVSVVLRDAKGTLSFVHYMTKDAGVKSGGGSLSFRTNKTEKGTTFLRGSDEETELLKILRSACIASFGSADPEFLKDSNNWPRKKDGFNRIAMASLLRHFPSQAEQGGGVNRR